LLTARWRHILFVNFAVPAPRLVPLLPTGCELDSWAGRCFVSLVALRMERVRVRGLALPGLTAFPQVNLRFYVRHAHRPAVCFIQELVPSRLLVAGARWLYGEPFRAGYIRSQVTETRDGAMVAYHFGRDRPEAHLQVTGGPPMPVPADDTFAHWLKERTRGCRALSGGRLRTFDVAHPRWLVRRVDDVRLEARFAELYGAEWSILDGARPDSVLYAVGSAVSVSPPS
jgi:uncharacterized protein YqjF (DUF2071 family)